MRRLKRASVIAGVIVAAAAVGPTAHAAGARHTRIQLAQHLMPGLHKLTLGVRNLHRHRLTFAVC